MGTAADQARRCAATMVLQPRVRRAVGPEGAQDEDFQSWARVCGHLGCSTHRSSGPMPLPPPAGLITHPGIGNVRSAAQRAGVSEGRRRGHLPGFRQRKRVFGGTLGSPRGFGSTCLGGRLDQAPDGEVGRTLGSRRPYVRRGRRRSGSLVDFHRVRVPCCSTSCRRVGRSSQADRGAPLTRDWIRYRLRRPQTSGPPPRGLPGRTRRPEGEQLYAASRRPGGSGPSLRPR